MRSKTAHDQHAIAAARRRMKPLAAAVQAGDESAFRAAIFATEHGVIDLSTAEDLQFGFETPVKHHSLAEACFQANRIELLRIALEARHPDKVGDFNTASKSAWLRHLSRRSQHCEVAVRCLGVMAYWNRNATQGVDFLELAIEYDSQSPDLVFLEENNLEAGAVIRAARMRVQLRAAATAPSAADLPAPAGSRSRRLRMV